MDCDQKASAGEAPSGGVVQGEGEEEEVVVEALGAVSGWFAEDACGCSSRVVEERPRLGSAWRRRGPLHTRGWLAEDACDCSSLVVDGRPLLGSAGRRGPLASSCWPCHTAGRAGDGKGDGCIVSMGQWDTSTLLLASGCQPLGALSFGLLKRQKVLTKPTKPVVAPTE